MVMLTLGCVLRSVKASVLYAAAWLFPIPDARLADDVFAERSNSDGS